MAIDFDLNLFTSDPRLLERGEDAEYERAAEVLAQLADPGRLRLLHALLLGEDTAQRAAVWSAVANKAGLFGLVEQQKAGNNHRLEEHTEPHCKNRAG